MQYGVAYYPEHKNPEELATDLKLIIESQINTVRMGEFAWCKMEPAEGSYDFTWLDEAVEMLGKAGIKSIICTPTACPPAWLIEKHPQILYEDNRGMKRSFGGRRFYCYNHPVYREYCAKIADEIGRRYGNHPYVSGFQIDNEPAQEASGRCHCPVCREKFSGWLEHKYGSISEYNQRSGNIFWGQEYQSFKQISPPVNTIEVSAWQALPVYFENPTLRLEYERFCSESQIKFQNIQADILHKMTRYPVTTNGTGLATNSINYYQGSKNLDCYGFDYYPGLRDKAVDSFPYAFARGVKRGLPFWVMEFMSGGGHRFGGSGRQQPNPGALKQAVIHSFAQGASMMLHFQYRTFPFGAEQLNYAIVDMDGIPRRRYYEMQETAMLLKQLEPFEGAGFTNEIAVCIDYDCHWALRIKPVNDPDFEYMNYAGRLYRLLGEAGYNADVIGFDTDFSGYRVLVLPAAFITSRKFQRRIREFTENGGIVLATFLTSVKNEDNVGYTQSLPVGMREMFGVTVKEVEPVFDDNHTRLQMKLAGSDCTVKDNLWSELLGGPARALGSYIEDYKTGEMVISEMDYGRGQALYLGTDIDDAAMKQLLSHIAAQAGIRTLPVVSQSGVEVVHRRLDHTELYYVFNFTTLEVSVKLMAPMTDILKNNIFNEEILIERNGFRLLKKAL